MQRTTEDEPSCEGLRQDLNAITKSKHSNPCQLYHAMRVYLTCLEDCNQLGSHHDIERVWRESVVQRFRCQAFKDEAKRQQADTECYNELPASSR